MIRISSLLGLGVLLAVGGASAQPISLRDSFPIGSGPGIVCTAQVAPADRALADMFDRGYAIVCRDAATAVGRFYALRARRGDPAPRLASIRNAECAAAARAEVEGLGAVETLDCRQAGSGAGYRVYLLRRGNTLYAAEGLAGYDSALQLALRTIVGDRPVEGQVSVATTGAGDPAAFARAQAAALDPRRALEEAYRRNNAGSYAEASEFFGILTSGEAAPTSRAEALVNQALQRSNLDSFGEADALFDEAAPLVANDPVLARRLRNYRAMHLLNQLRPEQAMAELDRPLPPGARALPAARPVDAATAARLNRDRPVSRSLEASAGALLAEEKVAILEAQAQHLRGTIHRIEGRAGEAEPALADALARLVSVRGGTVASTMWMQAQILGELAAIDEGRGDPGGAERRHQEAIALLAANYPGSAAWLAAQARLAGFYARTGRTAPALALYRQIVDANIAGGNASPTLGRALAPYFALLAADGSSAEAVADMFRASQILLRPGVAQTQAVLARELSAGSDEAARLFRQSVSLTRDIERTRVEIARLGAAGTADPAQLAALQANLATLERDQTATQARLAEFPRYRAVSTGAMSLQDLQRLLRPDEAYYKMTIVGDAAYAIWVTPSGARAWRIDATPAALDADVDALRETIAVVEDGRTVTYPFDVDRAFALYRRLFAPVESELAAVRHLVFEPDGAMLRLPPNLLVTEQAGLAAYRARAARGEEGLFDLTGLAWLGRDRDISTAVSAPSFRDVRQIAPSRATREFLGFGENAPAEAFFTTPARVGPASDCSWSPALWARPISAEELVTARQALAGGDARNAELVTGAAFTDDAIKARDDLTDFRIVHFATHGLLRAPREECPARPALLTSFGGPDSDGLLTFSEIFDLRIDADLVILSACDTAGGASLAATREAGITSGGDFALDGLVRAFVGAGGRSVVASHWPVPDDFDATKRLISGLFTASPGMPTATALRRAQRTLMDDPETSHPYYWSGFAIVGDGARPVIPAGGGARGGSR
ncbi:MAG TPA: CHAT domain-containing protein [Allosphingosinicella sp.]|jgi:CHAT domain-containing protein/predicted GNAT family N-acyltransferase